MLKLFTFAQVAADSLRRREEGQTMAEYGVVLAVITLAVIGAITLLSDNARNALESVANVCPRGHATSPGCSSCPPVGRSPRRVHLSVSQPMLRPSLPCVWVPVSACSASAARASS